MWNLNDSVTILVAMPALIVYPSINNNMTIKYVL